MREKTSVSERRAMVLVVVLVVVSLLSLAALTFSKLMMAEHEAADLAGRLIQGRMLAESGQEAAATFLGMELQNQIDAGGWYSNPDVFQGVLVVDAAQPRKRGRFTLVAPALENGEPVGIRFGLENLSGRLNLNTVLAADKASQSAAGGGSGTASGTSPSSGSAARDILMQLPGMDEQIADCILDWMDPDDEPREFGAEVDTYSGLDPPYAPKNGPLDTIEELLLVQGVTPSLLFGVDANRNWFADSGEPDPLSIEDVDNSDGAMNCGWAAYLTLTSGEVHLRSDGEEKIDLNQSDLQTLYDELTAVLEQDWVNYIIAYRQNGPADSSNTASGGRGGGGGGAAASVPKDQLTGSLDLTAQAKQEISSVLDLIGGTATATTTGDTKSEVLNSPFSDDPSSMSSYLPELMDAVYAGDFEGRININQAPKTVLACIPGMTADLVDQILARRQQNPIDAQSDPTLACEAWPLLDGMVTLDEMKKMQPYVTAGGSIYQAQIVGYFDQGGPTVRIEVVIDATNLPAAIVSWRDMSYLGPGYPVEVLGVDDAGMEAIP
jgi:hypothetical protein